MSTLVLQQHMITTIFRAAGAFIASLWKSLRGFFKRIGWKWGTALVAGVVIVFLTLLVLVRNADAPQVAAQESTPKVALASVADLTRGGSSLSVAGTVESQTEATVRAEKGGEITRVNYALGDAVAAGAVVAEIDNAAERAAVLQAEGAVQAATAAANTSATSLSATKDSAVAALLSAYGTVEKAVHTDTDPMFTNPNGTDIRFNVQSADSQAVNDSVNGRGTLGAIIAREEARSSTLSSSDDLVAEAMKTESELKTIRDYLDNVIRALNAGVSSPSASDSAIAGYKATATASRSTITTALSALISTRQGLENAQKAAAQGEGAISSTQAALTQAQGALAAAKANLEKSIIRAPISGTINSLDLKRGDYVQALSPVLTVANNGALEVTSYVTADDAPRIAVGDEADVDGVKGTITRIAPALDPLTKKIEVRVGLPAAASQSLINGQSVVVTFTKPATAAAKPVTGPLVVPISALKIGSENTMVFTVSTSSTLVPHNVTLGALMGDRVEIKDGVTQDMIIVTDARGLQAGETVIVQQ
jgi:RND family efflux transporter MFP subunit